MTRKRGGIIGGILGGLGQRQTTNDTPETQIKIPNLATFWRILWMWAGWLFAFLVVLPFGVQWAWSFVKWALPKLLYSMPRWCWTMPVYFDILRPFWRLLPVLLGFEVVDAAFGIRSRFKKEVKHPTWPPPFKAIHPAEYTDEPGQAPKQWEIGEVVEQDVASVEPEKPMQRVRIEVKDKNSTHYIDEKWENYPAVMRFAQAVAHHKRNFSVGESRSHGVTPTDYDKLKDDFETHEYFLKSSIGPRKTLQVLKKGYSTLEGIADTPPT